uniref:Uncharacterized protein n=1 Tax=viral metagenome TaxID=1070528 RepID=A0A6C0ADF6_9ZZZZ
MYAYKDIFKKHSGEVHEIVNEVLLFYTSYGFKWGSGIKKGLISKATTNDFKDEFDKMLMSLSSKYSHFTKNILKKFFSEFTNSKMFERIYYRTNPMKEYDSDDFHAGITNNERNEFLNSFWNGLNKLIFYHKEKLNEKTYLVAIFSMTH